MEGAPDRPSYVFVRTLANVLVFKDKEAVQSINLVPPSGPAADSLTKAMQYLADPAKMPNGRVRMQINSLQLRIEEDSRIAWLLTRGYLCRYDLKTGDIAYFLLYHPISDHSRPELLNRDLMVKNEHYWGGITGGMWIKGDQLIVFFSDEIAHVYQLPAQ